MNLRQSHEALLHSLSDGMHMAGTEGAIEQVMHGFVREMQAANAMVFSPVPPSAIQTTRLPTLPASRPAEYAIGLPPGFFGIYESRVRQIDAWRLAIESRIGDVLQRGGLLSHELLSPSQLRKTAFYAEHLQRDLDMQHMISIALPNGQMLALLRSPKQAEFSNEDLDLLIGMREPLAALLRLQQRLKTTPPATQTQAIRPMLEIEPQVARCALRFGLTEIECRVLAGLVMYTPAQVAAQMDRRIPTIRSHMARLFAKTGTTRQAELVWLLASC
jgi:DNA-binding CsgD family transcriptional regulator